MMNTNQKKLLIVVDYQNDFVIGAEGFKRAQEIEDNIVNKIKYYQKNGDEVVFTFDTHFDENYEKQSEKDNITGWQLYGEVKNLISSSSKSISKHTFASLDLSDLLRAEQYDRVELIGVVTNICVLANAVVAQISLPDAEIIIDSACVASDDDSLHEKALDIMESLNFTVINRKKGG